MEHSSIKIVLNNVDRVYRERENVEGYVIVAAKKGWTHTGLRLHAFGEIILTTNRRSSNLTNAFNTPTIPSISLLKENIELVPPGSFPDGLTKIPFKFHLSAPIHMELLETFHGKHVSVTYTISVKCDRGMMAKNLENQIEFVVECPNPSNKESSSSPIEFDISKNNLNIVAKSQNNRSQVSVSNLSDFQIIGKFHRSIYSLTQPLTGEFSIVNSTKAIKSIEIKLERKESISSTTSGEFVSEIQNIQVAKGDVPRDLTIPIYMIFPRLYTCPTYVGKLFNIEFLISLVVVFEDNYAVSEIFPLKLLRSE